DALFIAACDGDEIALQFMLSHNAPVTASSGEIGTAVNVAAHAGHLGAVKTLHEHGGDINPHNKLHGIAFKSACDRGYLEVARYLASCGADIDVIDLLGRTPLHIALRKDRSDLVDML
ncbi:ankyrin, partial [Glonium stellatum]